jgi:hypothetical protein
MLWIWELAHWAMIYFAHFYEKQMYGFSMTSFSKKYKDKEKLKTNSQSTR